MTERRNYLRKEDRRQGCKGLANFAERQSRRSGWEKKNLRIFEKEKGVREINFSVSGRVGNSGRESRILFSAKEGSLFRLEKEEREGFN